MNLPKRFIHRQMSSGGWALLSITLVYVMVFFNFSIWKKDVVLEWDAWEYYLYLPATFVHHNYQLDFAREQLEFLGSGFNYSYMGPLGQPVIRMSMGLALLELPFFLAGHAWALCFDYPATGFAAPYYFFLLLGTWVYATLGNWYLIKVLRLYFTEAVSAVCLLLVNWGTNLFYFVTTEPLMTHTASFMLFSLLLYFTIQFYREPQLKYAFLTGMLLGLITLVRPTNAVAGLVLLLWGVQDINSLVQRVLFFLQRYTLTLVTIVSALLIWTPQLVYWKTQTGKWYYYTYGILGKFYFNQPHLWDALFSFRKGWLLYTPVMALVLTGMWYIRKYVRDAFLLLCVFVPLNIYIVSSFWCWWYGAGFGLRPMIDSYPLLMLCAGALLSAVWNTNALKKLLLTVLILLAMLNQVQTYQARKNILHFDSVTAAYYKAVFLKLKKQPDAESLLRAPDYHRALKGEEVY